jgi:hypothetical protein
MNLAGRLHAAIEPLRERAPVHVRDLDRSAVTALLSHAALWRWMERGAAARAEQVYAHRDGRTSYLPQAAVHEPARWAQARLAEGATIVANGVSQQHEPLARLCEAVAAAFGAHAGANAFLAPPGARGYAAHFDTDDTIFVQLEGSKHWRLYEGPIALPLPWQLRGVDEAALGPARLVELRAGEALYLPRGWVHTPVAGDTGSLHVTIGLQPLLVRDRLVEALQRAAQEHPALRERARPGDARALAALAAMLRGPGAAEAHAPAAPAPIRPARSAGRSTAAVRAAAGSDTRDAACPR